jgi:flavin-binding protein dodecin
MGDVARITQISARSSQGFDDAVRVGIERANQTLRNVSGAWVKEEKVLVQDGQITDYQVVLEITFVLEAS